MERLFYTDGSVKNNGRPGAIGAYAWVEINTDGYIVRKYASSKDLSGMTPTNQRMEMMAVISALNQCSPEDRVTIFSDSAYVVNGMNQKWYKSWSKTGKNSAGKRPANMDLWNQLIRATNRLASVEFILVKGHADNEFNNMCDQLASMLTSHPELDEISMDPLNLGAGN